MSDMTGDHWVTCFQNAAEVVMGHTTEELGAIMESKDENQMDSVFVNATFKSWILRLRAKVDTFNVSRCQFGSLFNCFAYALYLNTAIVALAG